MAHISLLSARRASLIVAGVAILAIVTAGCGSTSAPTPSAHKTSSAHPSLSGIAKIVNGASQVVVTLTTSGGSDTCTADHNTAKAGPVTFTVKDVSSTAINEVELQSHGRVLGEKENLAPGLAPDSFTSTLTGGTYELYCPGASKEFETFTVTGTAVVAEGGAQGALKAGIAGYAAYVTNQVASMVKATHKLNLAIQSGDLGAAQKDYGVARPFYERVESDVEGFVLPGFKATDNAGNLDYLIDMRASNVDPKVGWHGFHAVERDIFKNKRISANTKTLAAELSHNVQKLDRLSKSLTYKPEDLANGASDLLEEVQSSKITGEEELYSHIDIVDFAANVEGAQQSFSYLEPGLKQIDPALTNQLVSQFASVNALLEKYKDATAIGGYVKYTKAIKAADGKTLSAAVEALHESLSGLAEKVATA